MKHAIISENNEDNSLASPYEVIKNVQEEFQSRLRYNITSEHFYYFLNILVFIYLAIVREWKFELR